MDKKILFKLLYHVIFCYSAIFSTKILTCDCCCCIEGLIKKQLFCTETYKVQKDEYNRLITDSNNLKDNNKKDKETIKINSKELTIKQNIEKFYFSTDEGDKNDEFTNCFIIDIEGIPCCLFRDEEQKDTNKKLIVCYGGNGESFFVLPEYFNDKQILKEYDILKPQLPGYPFNNEGNFSEEFRNTQQEPIINFVKKYYYGEDNKIFSYSLGCHFGILLAAKDAELSKKKGEENIFKKLIIACPFYNTRDEVLYIVEHYDNLTGIGKILHKCFSKPAKCLLKTFYKKKILSNEEYIKNVKCNIDILYIPTDSTVNPKDAEYLYKIKINQKEKGEYNNNVRLRPLLSYTIKEYIVKEENFYEYSNYFDKNIKYEDKIDDKIKELIKKLFYSFPDKKKYKDKTEKNQKTIIYKMQNENDTEKFFEYLNKYALKYYNLDNLSHSIPYTLKKQIVKYTTEQ